MTCSHGPVVEPEDATELRAGGTQICRSVLLLVGAIPWSARAGQTPVGYSAYLAHEADVVTVTAGQHYRDRLH